MTGIEPFSSPYLKDLIDFPVGFHRVKRLEVTLGFTYPRWIGISVLSWALVFQHEGSIPSQVHQLTSRFVTRKSATNHSSKVYSLQINHLPFSDNHTRKSKAFNCVSPDEAIWTERRRNQLRCEVFTLLFTLKVGLSPTRVRVLQRIKNDKVFITSCYGNPSFHLISSHFSY